MQHDQASAGLRRHRPVRPNCVRVRQLDDVQCGAYHCVATSVHGDLYVWGKNACGQLGLQASETWLGAAKNLAKR